MTPQVEDTILQKLAFYAVELINEQAEQGIDMDGKHYQYSTKPFARPIGDNQKFKVGRKTLEKQGKIKLFRAKSGGLWVLVTGGYKSYREMMGRDSEGDFLQFSGAMLQALSGRATDGKAEVYFTDAEQARKAFWFNVSGVGKSRKLWKFMGLNAASREKLERRAAELLVGSRIASEYLGKISLEPIVVK